MDVATVAAWEARGNTIVHYPGCALKKKGNVTVKIHAFGVRPNLQSVDGQNAIMRERYRKWLIDRELKDMLESVKNASMGSHPF